jgi:hypothetical protein
MGWVVVVVVGWGGENQDERENADKKGEKGGGRRISTARSDCTRASPIGVFHPNYPRRRRRRRRRRFILLIVEEEKKTYYSTTLLRLSSVSAILEI